MIEIRGYKVSKNKELDADRLILGNGHVDQGQKRQLYDHDRNNTLGEVLLNRPHSWWHNTVEDATWPLHTQKRRSYILFLLSSNIRHNSTNYEMCQKPYLPWDCKFHYKYP